MKRIVVLVLVGLMVLGSIGAQAGENGWWNILLMGDDSRDRNNHVRTDCMMILSVNSKLSEARLSSIMRDTWVSIPGKNKNKINAAQVFGGPELAVQTVNQNFGMDIENYILINMGQLVEIVDLMGGVDLEISESERKVANQYASDYLKVAKNVAPYQGETSIPHAGKVHLNGLMAMSFCRDRYTDSDFGRVMRHQKLLLALADKAQNMEIQDMLSAAGQMKALVSTNLTDEQVQELAKAILTIPTENVGQLRLPAEGAYKAGTFDGTWMIKADLEKNARILKEHIYGE